MKVILSQKMSMHNMFGKREELIITKQVDTDIIPRIGEYVRDEINISNHDTFKDSLKVGEVIYNFKDNECYVNFEKRSINFSNDEDVSKKIEQFKEMATKHGWKY
ncbi:TPA: hypothetical protein KR304_003503 [Clostridioides difficile]|uniref:hypothetical protein n=1 Tax=Clostridioides difficile TaxID=1496 RepID=UPI00093F820F|nr:hypothetical protein [Clostridioides difficile]EGT3757668.1 hypothetical protein [Clostridioides difficile]EGT4159430.1 hypothetical protein [Clostridioides difficile]EGT4635078.1 hypothetical protein [Clostridioides difficile]EGT4831762.1 hypothetical protein [Clostridioides difficile]EII6777330.1 hypothetical protein [Clostridioides difficile]